MRSRGLLLAAVAGALLGAGILAWFLASGGGGFREVPVYRPLASEEQQAVWDAQHERRAVPVTPFPDPPGEGPVFRADFWLSRAIYPMEVRRRGSLVTLAIHGVDRQEGGGAWTAFAEGWVTGEPGSLRGAVASVSWSCLGVTYFHASDGTARLEFSPDGRGVVATYGVNEDPEDWSKAYGRLAEGDPPPYGSLEGQIPIGPVLRRLPDDAEARVRLAVVRDDTGAPVPDAVVLLKGVPSTRAGTDADGRAVVVFRGRDARIAPEFAAAAPGFRSASRVGFVSDVAYARSASDEVPTLEVRLSPLAAGDHPDYRWVNPAPDADPEDPMACGTCHSWQYTEWIRTRHARSADHGHVAWEWRQMTDWGAQNGVEVPDDCRGCHQPADAVDRPGGGWTPRGPLAGVHCDFCHKVAAVVDVEKSGVFGALRLERPDPAASGRPGRIGHVFGPNPDAVFGWMGGAYGPHLASSDLCGGCHQGGGRAAEGTPKLDTWREWRTWTEAGAGGTFRTCQDCHMAPGTTFDEQGRAIEQVAWNSLRRGAESLHSHRFEATGAIFAAKALDLRVEKRRDAATGEWVVTVALKNRDVGHKVPTGTWSKQVGVGVWARAGGRSLRQTGGDRARVLPRAPDEALAAGDWRNPGGFVLRVRPADAEASSSASFWAPWGAGGVVDERLAPGAERTATCRFEPSDAEPEVEVQVVHRRGDLGAGPAWTPWEVGPYDPPPQTLWMRVVR